MSDSINSFLDSLRNTEQDVVWQVLGSLNSDYITYINEVEQQLQKAKDALNIINKQREFLSDDLAALEINS